MTVDSRIFPEARAVLDALFDGLGVYAPGLITGCHITGSIALGDGRPGQSDIDLVLVRDEAGTDAETMAALEPVIAELRRSHPRPVLDGLVLTEADLAAGPDRIEGERPVIFDNVARLAPDGSGRSPVTWQTMRQCGITYRGEPLDPARMWDDPAQLDAWTRDNLEHYWRPWTKKRDRLLSRVGIATLGSYPVEWGVLGVTRLHYTLATGAITSKHGAGLYALETFGPEWHPIVEEALRIRERRTERSHYLASPSRRRAMRAYVSMVIDAALAIPAHGTIMRSSPGKEVSP